MVLTADEQVLGGEKVALTASCGSRNNNNIVKLIEYIVHGSKNGLLYDLTYFTFEYDLSTRWLRTLFGR